MHNIYIYICLVLVSFKATAQDSFKDILDSDFKTIVDIMSKDYVFSGEVKLFKDNESVGYYDFKVINTKDAVFSENMNGFVLNRNHETLSCIESEKTIAFYETKRNGSNRKIEKLKNKLANLIDSVSTSDQSQLSFKRAKEGNTSKVIIESKSEEKVITYILTSKGNLKGVRIDYANAIYDYLYIKVNQLSNNISKPDLEKLNLDTYLDNKRNALVGIWEKYKFQKN